jgi:phage terminase large subunit-like protein
LLDQPTTARTHAPTYANRANLPDAFLYEVRRRYAGTRQGAQELDGMLLSDADGTLWPGHLIAACQTDDLPQFDRIVVAVDPSVSAGKGSDECGIIVAGAVTQGPPENWRAWVLEDATVTSASPVQWAKAAVAAMERHNADRLVAEVNQGGDLVQTVLRQVAPTVPFRALHASRGKVVRAEPVAAIYEQGRVHHVRGLSQLEEQMSQMTTRGFDGSGSPDRVDALVWAIHELIIEPAKTWQKPRLRLL